MMLIHNLRIKYQKNPDLVYWVAKHLQLNQEEIAEIRVIKKSLDARAKPQLYWVFSLQVFLKGESEVSELKTIKKINYSGVSPIIIGAGPAGLFAAHTFLQYGIKPILFERGARTHQRMLKISQYWRKGILDLDSNVCHGEGGAGTFSDGKLITRIKSPLIKEVMKTLVNYGAPPEIEYVYNPHVGSNLIREVIRKMSDDLMAQGAQLFFNTRVEKLGVKNQSITGVTLADGTFVKGEGLILACGHSAGAFFESMLEQGVRIEAKPFAMGFRIEHLQNQINQWQYGDSEHLKELESAQYKLSTYWDDEDKGVYSFCMCPGGYVLSSGTESDGIVVNGMSNYHRNSPWANAAIVCSISTQDVLGQHPLKMKTFQREIEQRVFQMSKLNATGKEVPAQRLEDFLANRTGKINQKSSCPSGVIAANLNEIFPEKINRYLLEGFQKFEKNRPGFYHPEALLHAVESRTSSPIRIPRDSESFESVNIKKLYPCGEGPGYAGGITSAAVDGMNAALAWIKKIASERSIPIE